jgi:hypothetical protein
VITTHLIDFASDDLRVDWLNASSGTSWSHRATSMILVIATSLSAVEAGRRSHGRYLWLAMAAILAFLSISELSSLHSRIDQASWGKVIYAPLLVALAVCILRAGSSDTIVLRVGLATLLASFVIHVFGPHLLKVIGWDARSWGYEVKVGLKQGTELAGWLLIVIGLWKLRPGKSATPAGGGERGGRLEDPRGSPRKSAG